MAVVGLVLALILWARPVEEAAPVAPAEPWRAGGPAFADAICERQVACACATAHPEICRKMWAWAGPREAEDAACVLSLECPALCAMDVEAPACFAAAKAVTARRPKP